MILLSSTCLLPTPLLLMLLLMMHLLIILIIIIVFHELAPYPYSCYSCCSKCLGFNFSSFKIVPLIASIVKTHSNLVLCKTFARHSFHKHNIWPGMSEKVVIVLVCLPCGSSSSAPCNLTLSRHEYAPRGNLESLARGKIVKYIKSCFWCIVRRI